MAQASDIFELLLGEGNFDSKQMADKLRDRRNLGYAMQMSGVPQLQAVGKQVANEADNQGRMAMQLRQRQQQQVQAQKNFSRSDVQWSYERYIEQGYSPQEAYVNAVKDHTKFSNMTVDGLNTRAGSQRDPGMAGGLPAAAGRAQPGMGDEGAAMPAQDRRLAAMGAEVPEREPMPAAASGGLPNAAGRQPVPQQSRGGMGGGRRGDVPIDTALSSTLEGTASNQAYIKAAEKVGEGSAVRYNDWFKEAEPARTDVLRAAGRTRDTIGRIDDVLSSGAVNRVTGLMGAFPNLPGSAASNAQAFVDHLVTNLGLNRLLDQKSEGAYAGAISDFEVKMFQQAAAVIDAKQDPEAFKKNLLKLRSTIVDGLKLQTDIYEYRYGNREKGIKPKVEFGDLPSSAKTWASGGVPSVNEMLGRTQKVEMADGSEPRKPKAKIVNGVLTMVEGE